MESTSSTTMASPLSSLRHRRMAPVRLDLPHFSASLGKGGKQWYLRYTVAARKDWPKPSTSAGPRSICT